MRRLLTRVVGFALLLGLFAPPLRAAPGAERLVLGLPIYREGETDAAAKPLAVYLSQVLDIPVEIRMAEPYEELPRLLRTGGVDVAQIAPLAYVTLKSNAPAVRNIATVVISGNPTYLGHFYVRKESRFHSLSDLRGARIGYVKPQSTSGYLFPRELLRRKNINPETFFGAAQFLGSHPAVIASVMAGDIDVGVAEDITSDWIGRETGRPEGLRVIAKTERIPNDCFVARPGLDDATVQRLSHALLDLHPADRRASAILDAMSINGWIASSEERYDRVRRVLESEAPKK